MDVHEYLLEKGMTVTGEDNVRYMYHDPCHTPFAAPVPVKAVNAILHPADGSTVLQTDTCCGESGTFAVARPDIATQVRFKKEENILKVKMCCVHNATAVPLRSLRRARVVCRASVVIRIPPALKPSSWRLNWLNSSSASSGCLVL